MPKNNARKCDHCAVALDGQCYVDGSLLLCADCAENLDMEREFGEEEEGRVDDYEETDGDIFDDRLDMYMREY